MRYGSVCSGIEAATTAWHGLGWGPQWFSEIEPFPCAVLQHHYPNVPNLGDMTKIHERSEFTERPIDLLVGGTPCQSFSVAGLRKGLADPRGNLALVFLGVVARTRPQWVVWENVPGVLSSNEGRDFGSFVGGLGEIGYGWAYRILDAQYFGVPQRRRRVFVVGHLGSWQPATAVLFERHCLSGNPPPDRTTREGTAKCFTTSPDGSGREDYGTPTLDARAKDGPRRNQGGTIVAHVPETSTALRARDYKGTPQDVAEPAFIQVGGEVRRLTPRECERLQGFPDDYTQVPYRKKPAADGPRYKALGNSMAVPCMSWIGKRIAMLAGLSICLVFSCLAFCNRNHFDEYLADLI